MRRDEEPLSVMWFTRGFVRDKAEIVRSEDDIRLAALHRHETSWA